MNRNELDSRAPFQDLGAAKNETIEDLLRRRGFFDPVEPDDIEHDQQKRTAKIRAVPTADER